MAMRDKRNSINGDDLLWVIIALGFENYVAPLRFYLDKYRQEERDEKLKEKGGRRLCNKKDASGVGRSGGGRIIDSSAGFATGFGMQQGGPMMNIVQKQQQQYQGGPMMIIEHELLQHQGGPMMMMIEHELLQHQGGPIDDDDDDDGGAAAAESGRIDDDDDVGAAAEPMMMRGAPGRTDDDDDDD
ncbi:nuclear transcription factor Y subunit beta-like [Impatiens glandulifera]|uniref:nuclear transcription factor Y subunit beta-like n=1 Tax=Impatiens glandulifera TaxID=253017 RepID=UPI001FB0C645|nr:nuclear transcription factor Y subunit beta-like [Impatiens glandulifera]